MKKQPKIKYIPLLLFILNLFVCYLFLFIVVTVFCRMMFPAWLLAAVVLVGVAQGDVSQCWEHPTCQELSSESSIKVPTGIFFFVFFSTFFKFIVVFVIITIYKIIDFCIFFKKFNLNVL